MLSYSKDNCMKPKVTIIIPTKNRLNELERLLNSIKKLNYPKDCIEVVIINNGYKIKNDLAVDLLIDNSVNRGLAYARNQGAKKAKGKYLLFVDDDNVLDKEIISRLVEGFLKNKEYIALGPVTYYLSSPKKLWFAGAKINLWTSKPFFYKEKDMIHAKNEILKVENLHNCLMLEKKYGDEVGWFDEKIFMNGTEFDLIQRIRQKHNNAKCGVVLNAKCFHDIPTFSKDLVRSLGFENPLRVYYFQRNRGVFLKRYGNFFQKISVGLIFIPLSFLIYSVIFISKKKWSLFLQEIKGTIAAYYYLFRPL